MRLLLAATAALSLAACDHQPPEPKVEVEGAVVQLPAVPGRPGAAYFTLRTNNDPTKLVSVTSPRVERIELHETVEEGGVSRMRPLQSGTFEGKEMKFEAGGKHAMLFGVDPALRAGDRIPLTFNLEPMQPVTVEAEVRAFGGGGHAQH
ncbi:MAG TPA: copper chaperone PCu(A)C [Allosphingosinicella sp.]|uniref:copper chaperone PCu(A)C n=1 Tax=Allosphingosinicella sp. TaxID=2823234 RepID=UPI002ED98FC4